MLRRVEEYLRYRRALGYALRIEGGGRPLWILVFGNKSSLRTR